MRVTATQGKGVYFLLSYKNVISKNSKVYTKIIMCYNVIIFLKMKNMQRSAYIETIIAVMKTETETVLLPT